MIRTPEGTTVYRLRMGRKDVGVALVVLLALALGWLLRTQVEGLTQTFEDSTSSFRMAYPATWASIDALQDVLLKVEDPQAPSTFKTTLTVESRELDLASPPTLQALVDRRIAQRETLTGYHLLANNEATVGGARSAQIEYAYVVQPLDTPLRASLPVVVRAREYIVVGSGHVYYLTLAAPENAFAEASQRFDALLQTVQL